MSDKNRHRERARNPGCLFIFSFGFGFFGFFSHVISASTFDPTSSKLSSRTNVVVSKSSQGSTKDPTTFYGSKILDWWSSNYNHILSFCPHHRDTEDFIVAHEGKFEMDAVSRDKGHHPGILIVGSGRAEEWYFGP